MDKANAMDNSYKSNDQRQPRMQYRRGQRKDVCCYNCNKCGHYSRDYLLQKRTRDLRYSRKGSRGYSVRLMKQNNLKPEDFAAKETKELRSISSRIHVVHSENVKPDKNHLYYFTLPFLNKY